MTAIDITRPTHSRMGFIANFPRGLFTAISEWQASNATRRALQKLTDRELNDIGLDRWDVEHLTSRDLR